MKNSSWFFVASVAVAAVVGMAYPSHERLITAVQAEPKTRFPFAETHPAAVLSAPRRPVLFEENRGQFDASVRYLSRGSGYSLFLTDADAVMLLTPSLSAGFDRQGSSGTVLRLQLIDSNQSRRIEALDEQPARSHYFSGGDPAAWHSGIPNYARVRYEGVYPGVDLLYYGRDGVLEYDFIVAPGSDPARIGLKYAGVEGLSVDAGGDLLLETANGVVRQHAPFVYQERDGVQEPVAAYYRVDDNRVSFQLAAYDSSRPLIIDPALSYASYLGGSGDDVINDIAVAADGAIYVTGQTFSVDLPGSASSTHSGAADAFVSKFSAAGELLFTTYLGGSSVSSYFDGLESGNSLAVAVATGDIYVTGEAVTGFPRFINGSGVGSCSTTTTDVFVAKLGGGGVPVYSDCFGGSQQDSGQGLALDVVGDVYVTGWTGSNDFTVNGYSGGRDAFVLKLGLGSGGALLSRYIGGSGYDLGRDVTLTTDAIYIVGVTNSGDLQSSNAAGGDEDVFVSKLSLGSLGLLWSRYIGGSGADGGMGENDRLAITSDFTGAVYITGQTRSTDFPLSNPYQSALNGNSDMFITKLSAAGTILLSTYLGGSGDDAGHDIAVAAAGDSVVLTGRTSSDDFPLAAANVAGFPYQGLDDALIIRLGATLQPLYTLYYGGSGDDAGHAIALQDDGSVYIGGVTASTDLAYVDQYPLAQSAITAGQNGFVARIGADVDLALTVIPVEGGGQLVYTITVTNNGPGLASHVVAAVQLAGGFTYVSSGQCVDGAPEALVVCDMGQLASGQQLQVSVTMTAVSGAQAPDVVVSANEYDTDLDNNVIGSIMLPDSANPPLLVVADGGEGESVASFSGGGGLGWLFGLIIMVGLVARWYQRRPFCGAMIRSVPWLPAEVADDHQAVVL